jgi:hypothetical protein
LEQAKRLFSQWTADIQENPELWQSGWNTQKIALFIRLWADKYGTEFLNLFGSKQ